ncbi:MAG: TldD/PmbA family protein [Candidatus Cloacimonetes bacterium]|nr:TldD/PmbA family protein [Candidatus Cloacimonadota bacterium]
MFEKLKKILNNSKAEYADIRYEKKTSTNIVFNKKDLKTIGANSTDGFVIRVLKNGGFATIAFTKQDDAAKALKIAEENAELISRNIKKPVKFAETEVIKENFSPILNEDPRKISMEEKLELVRKYNNIPLKYEKITTTSTAYFEEIREKYFVNSEGSEINESLITVGIRGRATAKERNLLQDVRIGSGGSDGFYSVKNQEENFEHKTKIALDLLKATPVQGGSYNCILNPSLAGVFAHEAFGHFSEADIIEALPAMRAKMQIGQKIGSDILNIIDDATMPNQLGFYKYDDEGVRVRKVQLIKNGILSGRLHSRRTAAEFNEPLSGHMIAEDYRFSPIVRMGNIYIVPGKTSLNEMFEKLGNGLYILDAKGGQTAGENFTFGGQYGYIIKDGKKAGMIRDLNISGNLYQTLKYISVVGDDFVLGKTGGCGKGQLNIRSCHGGPHILINNLVVGGI